MKHIKLLSLFTIILLFFSCSSEDLSDKGLEASNSISNSQARLSNTSLDDAKTLFKNMILTPEYQDYKVTRSEFVYNLNGNFAQLRDKDEAMTWISTNIHLTRFPNVGEFERQLDNMVSKQGVLMSRNTTLYSYLENSDAEQILEIIKPSLGTPPIMVINDDCSEGCMNTMTNDLNTLSIQVQGMYAAAMTVDPIQYGAFAWSAIDSFYWTVFGIHLNSFNDCIYSC